MRSKKFVLKTIAVFLAINITTQVLAPTVALALTSGPTTPEVSSFEPVDTTDMVNLVTGDFTYNMPLLEVPGPEGGYPVTLSNHGGVLPNQDASWVGLGWNLNPGTINRTPNNFADDYCGAVYTIRDSWNGGTTKSYTLGVGVGYDDVISVGVNVGVTTDTYKGSYGTCGAQMGLGIEGTDLGIGVGVEAGGGGSSGFAYVGSNSTGLALQLAAGNQDGQSYTSVSLASGLTQSSMGVTLSGGSTKFSATPTTMFVGNNARSGEISTHKGGFNVSIPIECFYVSLGYKYCRYWSSTQESTSLYGVLNGKAGNTAAFAASDYIGNGVSYDCAVLKDPNKGYADQTDMNWCANASVPCYDNYMVTGQGISGSIEPTILDNGNLFRANVEDITHKQDGSVSDNTMHFQSAFPRNFTKAKQFFRFLNDFSNSHVITPTNFSLNPDNTPHLTTADLAYTVNNLDTRGYIKTLDGNSNVTEARFAGSKHVEYYTNAEITGNTAKANGFINTQNVPLADRINKIFPNGSGDANLNDDYGYGSLTTPSVNVANNIGGYTITNEKGVSYHYALPVYTYNFYQCMENDSYGVTMRQIFNESPYAYTWLLTAVTGPDYIDANNDGFANPGDWGYWVNFDYGKFQANAGFRTPETGKGLDIDGSTIYSKGAKEIYYLDAISTRTHTALFIKDLRSDGKGTNGFDYESFMTSFTSHVFDGGNNSNIYPATNTLKLSEIVLIENSKLSSVFSTYNPAIPDLKACIKNKATLNCASSISNCDCIYNGRPDYEGVYNQAIPSSFTSFQPKWTMQSLWYNVIDMADMAVAPSGTTYLDLLRANAQKEVRFSYDYSLCPNTVNSFDSDPNVRKGKLTLNSVRFFGKGSMQLMPSTNFTYELPVSVSAPITMASKISGAVGSSDPVIWNITTSGNFTVGDILTFSGMYGTLISGSVASGFQMLFYGPSVPDNYVAGGPAVMATQTKNPPCVPDFTDVWGFFKSDYRNISGMNYNMLKATTPVSAKGVDCWSLRSIQTPTGATINVQYESDDYNDVVLKNYAIYNINPSFQIRNSTNDLSSTVFYKSAGIYATSPSSIYEFFNSNNRQYLKGSVDYLFTINVSDLTNPLTDVVRVGDFLPINAAIWYQPNGIATPGQSSSSIPPYSRASFAKLQVLQVTANSILVRDPSSQLIDFTGNDPNLGMGQFKLLGAFLSPVRQATNFIPGGGVRTAVISVKDGVNTTKSTNYIYGNASNSFGSTAYAPNSMSELKPLEGPSGYQWPDATQVTNKYMNAYYESYNKIIAYAKDLVAPGVLYRNVLVKNSVGKGGSSTAAPAYQSYQFQTFTDDMVQQPNDLFKFEYPNGIGETNILRTTGIINNTAGLGNLLSIKTYDKNNNLLSGVSNTYTSTPPNNQGRIDQVFNEQRKLNPHGNVVNFAVVTMKTELPSVLQSTTTRDYVKGISRTTSNTAFDFYSGEVTETQTVDANGNTIVSITEPAYNYYPSTVGTPGMGLKLTNKQNANMLSQVAASYTFKKLGSYTVSCNIDATGNGSEYFISNSYLPYGNHIGSSVTFANNSTGYITFISADRVTCKVVQSSNVSIPIGSSTITIPSYSRPLSATICTWSNLWNYRMSNGTGYVYKQMTDDPNGIATVQNENVWRQKSNYVWTSEFLNQDGTSPSYPATFDFQAEYAGTIPSTAPIIHWQRFNTNTLFSIYSKPLEAMDINGKYSSTKFCNGESIVLASAVNARYTEFTQCGAEYAEPNMTGYCEGEVTGATITTAMAHTGKNSFILPMGLGGIKYSIPFGTGSNTTYMAGKSYRISAWVSKFNAYRAKLYYTSTVGGTPTTLTQAYDATKHAACGNWVLLTMDITTPLSSTNLEVGVSSTQGAGSVYIDDFRFQPAVSSVTSYVYDQSTGLLTHVIGNDNRYTRYEYDARNKLKAVYKETSNGEIKVSEHNYNYGRSF